MIKNKYISRIIAAFLGSFFGVMILPKLFYYDYIFDRVQSLYYGDYTVYPAGFSKGRFYNIKSGMTQEQVINLIGNPIGKTGINENGYDFWTYTKPSTHLEPYTLIWIVFKDGKVYVKAKKIIILQN